MEENLSFHHIQVVYLRYPVCRFADQLDSLIKMYQNHFHYYQWMEESPTMLPSPSLWIEAGENIWLYSGVSQIKTALKTNIFFQFNGGYFPLKLIK